MSLTKRLEEAHASYSGLFVQAVYDHMKEQAGIVSARNREVLTAGQRKSEADAALAKLGDERDVVDHVKEMAEKAGVSIDDYLDTLPGRFRKEYDAALETVQPHLDTKEEIYEMKRVDIVVSEIDDTTSIYLPLLWDEKDEAVVPAELYRIALVAAKNAAKESRGELKRPAKEGDIVRLDIKDSWGVLVYETVTEYLNKADLTCLGDAGICLAIHNEHIKNIMFTIDGEEDEEEDEEVEEDDKDFYTIDQAIDFWMDHDGRRGMLRANRTVYTQFVGTYRNEGRLRIGSDSRISRSDLDDFLKYDDSRKLIKRLQENGVGKIDHADVSCILGISIRSMRDYVKDGKLKSDKDRLVSVHSMDRFTRKYFPVKGKWMPYREKTAAGDGSGSAPGNAGKGSRQESGKRSYTKAKLLPMQGNGHEYMDGMTAAANFEVTYLKLMELGREGKLNRFTDGGSKQHFFDVDELKSMFERRS